MGKSNWYYAGCFFVTIASVLGTGILALPVKTVTSGFYPFFVVLLFVLLLEEAVIIFAVELLQSSYLLLSRGINDYKKLSGGSSDDEETPEGNTPIRKYSDPKAPLIAKNKPRKLLNLHLIGRLFLPRYLRMTFDFCVYFHFISILISYVLAGAESWGQIFGIHVNCQTEATVAQQNQLRYVIVGFGVILTCAIIFGQRIFTHVVSIFTAVKGSLLVIMISVVGYVAHDIDISFTNDFKAILDSFLMCTVALGGVVGMMPLIYNNVPQTKSDIRKFRLSLVLGMLTCALLISLWTYFVMKVVPQRADPNFPSLTGAGENGCISTIPLTEIIKAERPHLKWIAIVVEVFILISVTVSFITVGSGLKNFVDAYAHKLYKMATKSKYPVLRKEFFYKILVYFGSFGISVGFALGKPKCFLVILEYFSSGSLNLENGFFISFMYIMSTKYQVVGGIPVPLPKKISSIISYVVSFFFLAAVVYDIVVFIRALALNEGLC